MSAAELQPRLRSLYRKLLRELPARNGQSSRNTTLLSIGSPIHSRIRNDFSSAGEANPSMIQIEEGEQYVAYLKAQRMYTTLVERYNPGMGMNDTERIRLTARRVGMNLPIEHKP